MRECKICHCETKENIPNHEKSNAHENFLEKVIINKYDEKDIYVLRLKDIYYKNKVRDIWKISLI